MCRCNEIVLRSNEKMQELWKEVSLLLRNDVYAGRGNPRTVHWLEYLLHSSACTVKFRMFLFIEQFAKVYQSCLSSILASVHVAINPFVEHTCFVSLFRCLGLGSIATSGSLINKFKLIS